MSMVAGEPGINESSLNLRIPLRPEGVTCGDFEPTIVRYIDGEASPARRVTLVEKMHQLGPWPGQALLVKNSQGELKCKLERARNWAEEYRAHRHLPPVVGIDGIDLWLTSACSAAWQLQALLEVGAILVCAVDSRYCVFSGLAFHLRVRGILVLREGHVRTQPPRLSPVADVLRSPAGSKRATRVNLVDVPAAIRTGCLADRNTSGVPMVQQAPRGRQDLSERRVPGKTPASVEEERAKYLHAYRNPFAFSRIVREHFGL